MVLIFYKLLFRKKKYDKFEIFSAWYRRRRRTRYMLTDTKLRNLKPRDKPRRRADRHGQGGRSRASGDRLSRPRRCLCGHSADRRRVRCRPGLTLSRLRRLVAPSPHSGGAFCMGPPSWPLRSAELQSGKVENTALQVFLGRIPGIGRNDGGSIQ